MTSARRSALGALVLVAALIAGLLVPLLGSPQRAEAASAADWDAGYIIDDKIFYDSTSMSAAEVQRFLAARVTNCASGAVCLKDYGQATGHIAADNFCGGYQAAAYQTAAQIIDLVARSCGINQRVLLVILEKEQSLVTSRSPSAWSYSAATGQACPDTAPCDPRFSGFFYQVYYAARQYQLYKAYPTSYGYRAGRTNNILYHPFNPCGTKSVYIQNQATAALYIYTPYTPNEAALRNMYGTGDSCSSYGNRNFWRLFTDWFGDPRSYTVHEGIKPFWDARGGAAGVIGVPISFPMFVEQNGQGWYQRFAGGHIYSSFTGGTVFVPNGAILTEYGRHGGPLGAMGWPNGEQDCLPGGKCAQSFVGAVTTTTAAYGAHVVWGGFVAAWNQAGGLSGSFGAALNDMVYTQPAAGAGWVQNYETGVLVQSAHGFQLLPYGRSQAVWSTGGGGAGRLGWPTSAFVCDGAACHQTFTGGVVTETSTFGAFAVTGDQYAEWTARGGMAGLGAAYNAATASTANGGGTLQNFAAGIVAVSASGRHFVPYGSIQATWSAAQAERGSYGWPTSSSTCDAIACAQSFQGAVLSSSAWGVHATFGSLASAWTAAGGFTGYGAALNPIRFGAASGGAWSQHYMGGVLTQQVGESPVFTPYGPIIDTWYHYGAEHTWLGWPETSPVCDGAGSCVQQFQNGVARTDGRGVSFTRE